ncbi:MAG: TRAP transporter large permease subunit [Treponema sp.]|jgi:tripartite ATP-independent transporter DctM subunit|nr:TRAP transporter large permease subunit [Treponema sp.]
MANGQEEGQTEQGEAIPEEKVSPAGKVLYRIENAFCIFSLVVLALLPIWELISLFARHLFKINISIPGSSALLTHMLLWAGMFAGMITTRNQGHLSIALVQYFAGAKIQKYLRVPTNLLSAFVVTILALSAPAFIKIGLSGRIISFLPDRIFALVFPIGYGIIAIRFARRTGLTGWKKIFPVLVILLGVLASFPSLAKFFWEYDLPQWADNLMETFYDIAWYIKTPAIIFLFAAALAGTPLFVVMAGIVLLLLEAAGNQVDIVSTDIYSALTNDNIIAIPLFTLVGFFLSESRAGERLVTAFRALFSWIPGGMVIAAVIICAFFTSFTGASGVTILALGGILFSILSEHGKYPPKFSIGLLTSVGSVGLMFPPSLPLILVWANLSVSMRYLGAADSISIINMFMGGLIPGIILVAAVIIFGIIASVKIKIPVEPFHAKKALFSLKDSIPEIILPFILIVCYFTGILNLVAIGAVAVVYIFITEVIVHKDIKFTDIPRVFLRAVPIIGGVLAILALAQSLSFYIIDTNAPAHLAEWMLANIQSKYVFLLLLNLALLVVGCLMDIFSAILIILPLVVPLGLAYGIDPVHLGIIFIVNLEVGFLTPPVGLNLFLASYRFRKSFVDICRYVFPFLLIQIAVVLLVTYIPALSTWLARIF